MKSPVKTVLVIEDNPINMELVVDVLEGEGYVVLQAANAEEGIQLAESRRPALILLDISLPGMDGLVATRHLKQNASTSHIPLVALTAHAMQGDRERARDAGCDGYLMKPIDVATFRKDVARFISEGIEPPSVPS